MPFIGHSHGYEQRSRKDDPSRYIDRVRHRWRARPHVNGRRVLLGYFDNFDSACKARDAFLKEHRQPATFVRRSKLTTSSNTSFRMTRCTPDELVTDYFQLAAKIARKWGRQYPWLADDFLSDALFALWKAAKTWPGEGAFATWAHRQIRWSLCARLRQERDKHPTAFRHQWSNALPGIESIAGPVRSNLDKTLDNRAAVAALLEQFTPAVREIIRRRFWGNESYEAIAAALGVSAEGVRQRLERWTRAAKEKLQMPDACQSISSMLT